MAPAAVEEVEEALPAPALLLPDPVPLEPGDVVPVELGALVAVEAPLPDAPVPVDEAPDSVVVLDPPPTLPAPKMVVEPMVVVMVSLLRVSVETMGSVVMAELPPAPTAVPVSVDVRLPVSVPAGAVVVEDPAPPTPVPVVEAPVSVAPVADPVASVRPC